MACKLWPGLADKESERAAASAASLTRPGRWAAFRSTLAGADHRVVQPWIGCVQAPVLVVIGEAGPDWKGPFGGGPVGRIQLRRCRHGHSPRRRPRPDVGKARRCGRALASAFWAESAGMVRRRSEIMLVADTDHARVAVGRELFRGWRAFAFLAGVEGLFGPDGPHPFGAALRAFNWLKA